MASRNTNIAMNFLYGCTYGAFIGKRFSHAHEHHVAESAFKVCCALSCAHCLFNNFTGSEMTGEASLTCGAKPTAHCTTCLGANAHGGAIGVEHEHGFNGVAAIAQLKKKLHRVAIGIYLFCLQFQCNGKCLGQLLTHDSRDIRDCLNWF